TFQNGRQIGFLYRLSPLVRAVNDRESPKTQSALFKPARKSAYATPCWHTLREEMTAGPPLRVETQQQRQKSVLISLAPLLWLRGSVLRVQLVRRRIPTYHGVRKSTHFSSLD